MPVKSGAMSLKRMLTRPFEHQSFKGGGKKGRGRGENPLQKKVGDSSIKTLEGQPIKKGK